MSGTVESLRGIALAMYRESELLASKAADLDSIADALDAGQKEGLVVAAYSQNDPRWAGQVYAGGTTFASAGCYVVCVSMLATFAGYADTPPQTAARMRSAGCFSGNMLSYPQRIPTAYPKLEWPPDAYFNREGDRLKKETWFSIGPMLMRGPLILKVDYKPENYKFNMHFILATGAIGDADLEIVDPIDGQRSTLLERYGGARGWSARQAIFGYRGLRVKK